MRLPVAVVIGRARRALNPNQFPSARPHEPTCSLTVRSGWRRFRHGAKSAFDRREALIRALTRKLAQIGSVKITRFNYEQLDYGTAQYAWQTGHFGVAVSDKHGCPWLHVQTHSFSQV